MSSEYTGRNSGPLNPLATVALIAGAMTMLGASRVFGRPNTQSYGFFVSTNVVSFAAGAVTAGVSMASLAEREHFASSPFCMAVLGAVLAGGIRSFMSRQQADQQKADFSKIVHSN